MHGSCSSLLAYAFRCVLLLCGLLVIACGDEATGRMDQTALMEDAAGAIPPMSGASVDANVDQRFGDAGTSIADAGGVDVLAKGLGLCEVCANRDQCGGPQDDCIRVEATKELYCSRDCRTKACPANFKCVTSLLTQSKQCVPMSETCEGIALPVRDP